MQKGHFKKTFKLILGLVVVINSFLLIQYLRTKDLGLSSSKVSFNINDVFHLVLDKRPAAFLETDSSLIVTSLDHGVLCFDKKMDSLVWKRTPKTKLIIDPSVTTNKQYLYLLEEVFSPKYKITLSKIDVQSGQQIKQIYLPDNIEGNKDLDYHKTSQLLTAYYEDLKQMYIIDSKTLEIIDSLDYNKIDSFPLVEHDEIDWSHILPLAGSVYNPRQRVFLHPMHTLPIASLSNDYFIQIHSNDNISEYAAQESIIEIGTIQDTSILMSEPYDLGEIDADQIQKIAMTKNNLFIEEKTPENDHYIYKSDFPKLGNYTTKTIYSWQFGSWKANDKGDLVVEHYDFNIDWIEGRSTHIDLGDYIIAKRYTFSDDYLLIVAENENEGNWHCFAISLKILRNSYTEKITIDQAPIHNLD